LAFEEVVPPAKPVDLPFSFMAPQSGNRPPDRNADRYRDSHAHGRRELGILPGQGARDLLDHHQRNRRSGNPGDNAAAIDNSRQQLIAKTGKLKRHFMTIRHA
jgi:hypothetical protein